MVLEVIRTHRDHYEKDIQEISKWSIPESEKEKVRRYMREYQLGKISGNMPTHVSLQSIVWYLRIPLQFLGVKAEQLTEKHIEKFIEAFLKDTLRKMNGDPYSHTLKSRVKIHFARYLTWRLATKPEKVATLTKLLKINPRMRQKNPPFLTELEVDKLYKSCKSNDERYFIAVLFSSGARLGEFYNVRKSDIILPIKNGENFVKIVLRDEFSKTKGRTISLYYKYGLDAVTEYFRERVNEGMGENDPLWNKSYVAARKWLTRFGQKVLNKNVYFHLFRHSSATWLANKLNRQELCYYFGWKFSSPMPDIYINREGILMKEVDEEFTYTEVGEVKAELSKQKQYNKVLEDRYEQLSKHFAVLEKAVEGLSKRHEVEP